VFGVDSARDTLDPQDVFERPPYVVRLRRILDGVCVCVMICVSECVCVCVMICVCVMMCVCNDMCLCVVCVDVAFTLVVLHAKPLSGDETVSQSTASELQGKHTCTHIKWEKK